MEIRFGLLALAANLSKENNLNILGHFDRINAKAFPTVMPSMTLVLRIEGHRSEVGEHSMVIKVVDEDGNMLAEISGTFELKQTDDPGVPPAVQAPFAIANASFPKGGNYSFDILIDGRYEGSIPLYVRQARE